ncbi:MAG: leucyl/phenylalanyl-tRNA--protein transferase [Acidobacteria bacterium]|nr:leucyl/phenylalanyl-tRNA--protein transferase [Acidobacteriota bacterium]
MTVYLLSDDIQFPNPRLADPSGLLAVGGDLSIPRLLSAYRQGVFPWYSEGQPILWWSPDPRMLFLPGDLNLDRDTRRQLKKNEFQLRLDTVFERVVRCCAAAPRKDQDGTWINEDMIEAYSKLHREGHAHSIEAWFRGELVGGLYGVAMGACFFGESMFTRRRGASKVALAALCHIYRHGLVDGQLPNEHLQRLGAREMDRDSFLKRVAELTKQDSLWQAWVGY